MKLLAPLINDISTDLEDPPALSNGAPYPGSFVPIVKRRYPNLGPLVLDREADAVFEVVHGVAGSMDRFRIDEVATDERAIRGVAVTPLIGFKDDFAIRVRADGTRSRVDMRSRSRLGKSDLGANAERIERFLDAVKQRLE